MLWMGSGSSQMDLYQLERAIGYQQMMPVAPVEIVAQGQVTILVDFART